MKMKKWLIIAVAVLAIAGNVVQFLNPQTIEKKVEVVKWMEKTNVVIKEVERRQVDGSVTIERTTVDRSETESNRDTATKTDTKPAPAKRNLILLGINPLATTDIQAVYAVRLIGNISAYSAGSVDLASYGYKVHAGLGFNF